MRLISNCFWKFCWLRTAIVNEELLSILTKNGQLIIILFLDQLRFGFKKFLSWYFQQSLRNGWNWCCFWWLEIWRIVWLLMSLSKKALLCSIYKNLQSTDHFLQTYHFLRPTLKYTWLNVILPILFEKSFIWELLALNQHVFEFYSLSHIITDDKCFSERAVPYNLVLILIWAYTNFLFSGKSEHSPLVEGYATNATWPLWYSLGVFTVACFTTVLEFTKASLFKSF